MKLTTVALAVIAMAGLFCSGCDQKPSQALDGAPPPNTNPRAWDCVMESVQKHFDPGATDVQLARQAMKACEEVIAEAERSQGIVQAIPPPDLEELLAGRAASGVEAQERKRNNQFRLETWQIARKVASDLLAPRQAAVPAPTASSAAASANDTLR